MATKPTPLVPLTTILTKATATGRTFAPGTTWTVEALVETLEDLEQPIFTQPDADGATVYLTTEDTAETLRIFLEDYLQDPTPAHLKDDACHVCGGERLGHGTAHTFWSNAEAAMEWARQPQGPTDVEARYVAEHRPA